MSAVPSPLIPPPTTATRAIELPFASCCESILLLGDLRPSAGSAVAVSALSGVYLRQTAGGGGHRSACLTTSAVCAAVAGLAVLASVLAGRATALERREDEPVALCRGRTPVR
ncbi:MULTISPECIES: hypothetical protein [unclassified Kitasatospora]|uniref:hypothetical protein n=1 Tax=unclassified Kitasatospora TaxID=2633591 RepID=UPI0033F5F622